MNPQPAMCEWCHAPTTDLAHYRVTIAAHDGQPAVIKALWISPCCAAQLAVEVGYQLERLEEQP